MPYSRLRQFLGSYFHQDWPYEGDNSAAIVDQFMGMESAEFRDEVAADISTLLGDSAADLTEFLSSAGCYFLPESEGMDEAGWLASVEARLTAGE